MRAVVQRVLSAAVTINGSETRTSGPGLLIFLGVMRGDGPGQAQLLAEKIHGLRVFSDEAGKLNLSLSDVGGQGMVISNFTLGTDCRKGRRPSFDLAAPPGEAQALYRQFVRALEALGLPVVTGEFGAEMRVLAENDGPVTLILDTEKLAQPRGLFTTSTPLTKGETL